MSKLMGKNEFLDKLAAGGLCRRDFNKALASVGLAAAAYPLIGTPARAAEKVTYFTWSGYDVADIH